ncbi:RDD family protein [Cellulomonas bogoriensis]|uniref:RDD domain-containing protein n=1 Tax=Cellulomonas bogoriensis 69B4 = DSM 16987 TaxID=1386082 RepID=A0A0A0BVZ0_9CELL|nr:RDD family protein [Cellulomonas bogoriensis]KGM12101.1 hypothetical protein N869_00495 [Cellulomonas bogoriensis 69B4 = DSM 16987]
MTHTPPEHPEPQHGEPGPQLAQPYPQPYPQPHPQPYPQAGHPYPAPGAPAMQPPGYPHPVPAGPPLAHWGSRVGASLIDGALTTAPLLVGYLVFVGLLVGWADAGDPYASPNPPVAAFVALILGWAGYIAMFIWNRVFRQGRTGRSVGKQLVGLTLIAEATGRPVGAGPAFLRDLVHVVDGFFYIGYLWPLWDEKRQTFADKIMATVVVKG